MKPAVKYVVEWQTNDKTRRKEFIGERAEREAVAYARKNSPRKPTVVKYTQEVIVSWETGYERHANGIYVRASS